MPRRRKSKSKGLTPEYYMKQLDEIVNYLKEEDAISKLQIFLSQLKFELEYALAGLIGFIKGLLGQNSKKSNPSSTNNYVLSFPSPPSTSKHETPKAIEWEITEDEDSDKIRIRKKEVFTGVAEHKAIKKAFGKDENW